MATGIDRTGRRAQATRARTTTDVQIALPRPTDFATVQLFVQLSPIMLGFSESVDMILQNKLKHFGRILRYSRKFGKIWTFENFHLITKTPWFSAKQSLESPPEVFLKVARNEVENASFAQRSAHRDSRIWRPELIESAAERKGRARGRRPTLKSAYPHPQILPQCNISSNYPYNVWFFWVIRHRSIILAKKNGNIFRQILRNSRKCVKTWVIKKLVDHKNTSVFFQAISGMSFWSFSYRWTQYQWEKNSYQASVHRAFSQRREKQGCFFG